MIFEETAKILTGYWTQNCHQVSRQGRKAKREILVGDVRLAEPHSPFSLRGPRESHVETSARPRIFADLLTTFSKYFTEIFKIRSRPACNSCNWHYSWISLHIHQTKPQDITIPLLEKKKVASSIPTNQIHGWIITSHF